ncbi:MAG: hypothetical protein EBS56_13625, partial [Planctomycetia bacterium]|nr:hypothetical protein [Planctomycetia bacterium]
MSSTSLVNNASLAINRGNTFTIASTISGSGSLTHQGSGTTILTADNTYSGTTTISAGTLQLGNGGTSGTVASASVITNNNLVVNRSDALTLASNISGGGNLIMNGTGTLTLTGTNSYTNKTTLNAGTLSLGSANAIGSGTISFGGGTLQ